MSKVQNRDGRNVTDKRFAAYNMRAVTGVLEVEVEANQMIQNELVFVEAFNGEVWGGADNYLVDFSYLAPVNQEIQKDVREISGKFSEGNST